MRKSSSRATKLVIFEKHVVFCCCLCMKKKWFGVAEKLSCCGSSNSLVQERRCGLMTKCKRKAGADFSDQ